MIAFFFFFDFKQATFAERLKALRTSRGLTLEALAKEVEATKAAIGNFETETKKPSLDALIALANYFDVSLDYLVGRSKEPTTEASCSPEALRVAAAFDAASEKDKTVIRAVLGI